LHLVSSWPAYAFALTCATVLASRSRRVHTVAERIALAAPAAALVLIACAQSQFGTGSLKLGGVIVLAVIAVIATFAGLAVASGRPIRWVRAVAAYLEYIAVAALIPVALWPLGFYERLGW
jgi:hypothetical protein